MAESILSTRDSRRLQRRRAAVGAAGAAAPGGRRGNGVSAVMSPALARAADGGHGA